MDWPESMWIMTIIITSSIISCLHLPPFCSAKLQQRKQRDFLLIVCFLCSFPPCSPVRVLRHGQACRSCRNVLVLLRLLLLCIVHGREREREKKRGGEERKVLR